MGYIEPVSLPSAAGVNFGEGDVRHFSEGDSLSVPGISNPTRHLAARDALIADGLNQVIAEVNNKEQIIPLPVYRMVMPPSTEEIVANHRIPNGYEARVLNVAVSSTPNSADIELNVLWAEGFGNVSGSAVMTTTGESSGGTTFSPAGEFIVQVKNKGGVTLDVVASVMVTMRPITDTSGALLPAATVAPAGPTGAKGETGGKGDTGGVGPAGSPGLNFRGQWVNLPYPITYQPNDVVSHDFSGTSQRSAFVCIQGHIANGINQPQPTLTPSPYWEWLAEAGETGSEGASGTVGVSFTSSTSAGIAQTAANFSSPGTGFGDYSAGDSPSSSLDYTFTESVVTADGDGMAVVRGSLQYIFHGSLAVILPSPSTGAAFTWQTGDVVFSSSSDAVKDVIAESSGSIVAGVYHYTNDSNSYGVVVDSGGTAVPLPVTISFVGVKTF